MGQFKQTVFLVDGRDNGWSYSLYTQPNRSAPAPNVDEMNNFAKKMAKLMGTGCKFTYARESLRGSPKVSLLAEYNASAQWAGDPAKPIEQAPSVILCQCWDETFTHKKNLFLHGVWDTAITGGTLATPAGWAALRDDFLLELTSGKYYFLGKTGEVNGQIASVAVIPNTRKILITTVDPFFAAPFDGKQRKEVTIKGVDTVPGLPNPVLVTPQSATTAVSHRNFLDPKVSAGTIRMNTFDLIQIKKAYFTRATTHRIGRPFEPSAPGRYKAIH